MDDDGAVPADHRAVLAESTKDRWRARLLAARRAVAPQVRAARDAALARHVGVLAAATICAYVPTDDEPGSRALLDALVRTGARVLLPVVDGRGPLGWAAWTGTLRGGAFGLAEPDGARLRPSAIADASVIVVPALAVAHDGVRLGRGGGFYDRSLPLADPRARVVGVVDDDELVEVLPTDPHDVPVGWVLTPGPGLVELRRLRARNA